MEPRIVEAHPEPAIVGDEKAPSVTAKSDSSEESTDEITDLFVSFPPIKGREPEQNPLTIRAVLIGICLGSLVNASNVYLGESEARLRNGGNILTRGNRFEDWFHLQCQHVWCHFRVCHRHIFSPR